MPLLNADGSPMTDKPVTVEDVKQVNPQPCVWWPSEKEPDFIETPLVPIKVELKCPECPDGKMEANGMIWNTQPPGVHHTCTDCGYTAAIRGGQFPTIAHREPNANV